MNEREQRAGWIRALALQVSAHLDLSVLIQMPDLFGGEGQSNEWP